MCHLRFGHRVSMYDFTVHVEGCDVCCKDPATDYVVLLSTEVGSGKQQ